MNNRPSESRRYNMSQIKNRNTKPEIQVRKFLFSHGFRYRINDKRYPGRPDLVLPKYKICIFINGCFWHVHEGCKYFVWPKNNKEFWHEKLMANVNRDRKNYQALSDLGWRVIVVWECELRKPYRDDTFEKLTGEIRQNQNDGLTL